MDATATMTVEPAGADAPLGGRVAYAAGTAVIALGYTGVFVAGGAPPLMAVVAAGTVVAPNALLGRVSLGLARRWPWPDQGRSGMARAVLAVIAIAAVATVGWLLLSALDARITLGTWRLPVRPIVLWQSLFTIILQLALLGAGYAWHNGRRAREAQDRARRAEALHARAELQLLRTQLNPHFLLNTLHALLGLVRRDPSTAEAAIERLGELLRFGMSVEQRRADRVALRDEWAFVTSYLELERLRLGERLRLELWADPGALDVPIPPFAVQPLVENAITHAVAPRASGGAVAVSVRCEPPLLRIEVRDDGPGASEAAILASPRMGLRLLRERLATLYAGRARLVFDSAEGGGLRVRLDLPDDGFPETP